MCTFYRLFVFKKNLCCALPTLTINPSEIAISSVQKGEINLDILMIQKDLTLTELLKIKFMLIQTTFTYKSLLVV